MILTALSRYYQRLASETNPHSGESKVPSYGFSEEKIGYVLVLSKEGELVDAVPNFSGGKKPKPKSLSVPRPEKRTGGIKANFLWDKSAYVLGVKGNPDKATIKERPWVASKKTFEEFKTLHLADLRDNEDAGLKALCLFLQNWQPGQFDHPPCCAEMVDANLVFRLDGAREYLHQSAAAQELWKQQLAAQDDAAVTTQCLVSGETAPAARLHPAIKGVYGGKSSGGSIVSFNHDAFTSYGKKQGENAPVSNAAAFAYTTALNYLLRRENGQCVSIGDTSTVFWAESDNAQQARAAEAFFGVMTGGTDDAGELQQLKAVLEKMAKGRPLQEFAPDLDPNTRFYVLGLAPNAARLSIRYWLDTTFGMLAEHFAQHWQDLQITPPAWHHKPPSIWQLLIETTPKRKDAEGRTKKSETKDIPPQLAGEFMRSILTGTAYPKTMLSRIIGRIRADGHISRLRVAIVKAVLNRSSTHFKEISMGLNKEELSIPYRLGRLFAVLEIAQSSALGNLNANIRDRYYGGASTTPTYVFPLLLKNYRNHISSLRKGKKAEWVKNPLKTAGWLEKEAGEIMKAFVSDMPFPAHLSLEEQGRFVVGYYHQKFTKQSEAPQDIASAVENTQEEVIEETQGE